MQVADYAKLITSQHSTRPRFMAVVSALAQCSVDQQALLQSMPAAFDLDVAAGKQLDVIGLWVGLSRSIKVPIAGAYFSWDEPTLGWERGVWFTADDSVTDIATLDDGTYRTLLRAKIGANHWNGSCEDSVAILGYIFGPVGIAPTLTDNQDMSMTITLEGEVISALLQAVIEGGYVPVRPVGVNVNFVFHVTPLSANLSPLILADNPWLYWKFDDIDTSGTVHDYSGNARDGSTTSGTAADKNKAPVIYGLGPSFGVASGDIDDVHYLSADFVDDDPISYVVMFKAEESRSYQCLIHVGDFISGYWGVALFITAAGALVAQFFDGTTYRTPTSADGLVSVGDTFMAGLSYNPGTLTWKLYLNGDVVQTYVAPAGYKINGNVRAQFGNSTSMPFYPASGYGSHAAVYKATLSAGRFLLYAQTVGLHS